jgi:hypothetical protein
MATMNPQKREETRYSGGITGASTVNPDFANGSASPILSGQALAAAQFGSGSPVTTYDYSQPKSSAPAKKSPAKAAAKPTPKPSVSASVASAKVANASKVSSRPSGESYSAPKKATVSSRADSASSSKPAPKASAPAAPKPKASVSNMYKATYGKSVPKKSSGPERNFQGQTEAQVAAINKERMDAIAREKVNPPKPKAKKPVSSSVNKMYKATYGTKLK